MMRPSSSAFERDGSPGGEARRRANHQVFLLREGGGNAAAIVPLVSLTVPIVSVMAIVTVVILHAAVVHPSISIVVALGSIPLEIIVGRHVATTAAASPSAGMVAAPLSGMPSPAAAAACLMHMSAE